MSVENDNNSDTSKRHCLIKKQVHLVHTDFCLDLFVSGLLFGRHVTTVEGTYTLVNFLWKHSHRHSYQYVWLIPYASRLASRITTMGPGGTGPRTLHGCRKRESGYSPVVKHLLFEHGVLSSMPITSNKIAKGLCATYAYPLRCLKQTV